MLSSLPVLPVCLSARVYGHLTWKQNSVNEPKLFFRAEVCQFSAKRGKGLALVLTYILADLVDLYEPSRCLRSTNCHLLAVPSCVKSSFAFRAFCVFSPNNWNSLPLHIRWQSCHFSIPPLISPFLFCLSRLATRPAPQIRPVSEITYNVSSGTLNLTHSLTHSLRFDVRLLALYKYLIDIDTVVLSRREFSDNCISSTPHAVLCTLASGTPGPHIRLFATYWNQMIIIMVIFVINPSSSAAAAAAPSSCPIQRRLFHPQASINRGGQSSSAWWHVKRWNLVQRRTV